MRIVITGGCGFVGRRFTRKLLNMGNFVTVVDDLSTGLHPEQWSLKEDRKLGFITTDVRDWMKWTAADKYDLIIHLAAVVGGRLKIDGDPLAVATDLSIDAEFFNWVVRAKNRPKIIYFSSSAAYPMELQTKSNHCQLTEEFLHFEGTRIGRPDMTYGWSKLSGEYLAQFAVKNYGADVVIYRPFGGYGEDQSFDYPFPSIIRRVINNENPVVVWGSGDQQRDFIHIDDIVDAVLKTMNVLKPGEALNLGTGLGLSFKELAILAGETLGIPVKVVNDPIKPEGVFARVADVTKLETLWEIPGPMSRLKKGIVSVAEALAKTKIVV